MRVAKAAAVVFTCVAALASAANAQLRIAQWNITNWNGSSDHTRDVVFQTSIYGQVPSGMLYSGKSMSPDVLIAEEITQGGAPSAVPWPASDRTAKTNTGQANVTAFLNLLNNAPGSPGDWAAAPYVANQGDTGLALFYRATRFTLISPIITLGTLGTDVCGSTNCGDQTNQSPRDNQRWQIRVLGYSGPGADLYIYAGHFKAAADSASQVRRIPEANRIRANAATLPAGSHYLLGADFNIQSSSQTAYANLVAAGSGQFIDPISRPGSWNSNCTYRNIDTQEPTPASTPTGSVPSGGMDDRFDQILVSAALRTGQGMSYIPFTPGGNILAAFISAPGTCSTGTPNPSPTSTAWFDANHSFRCWGNDGNHYNLGILNLVANPSDVNTMVGQTIAQALITTCQGNGHLPVYLDVQAPAKLGAPSGVVDLGTVPPNSAVTYTLQITNVADVPRFSKDGTGWGIDPLSYSLAITPGPFSISGGLGPFERAASTPAQINSHTLVLDTSSTGSKSATLTITSDDPDNPTRTISLIADVEPVAPPTGACCITGACSSTTQAACTGAYQGDNALCMPNPCPQPTGACCSAATGDCTITTQPACTGAYQGHNAACTPNPCPQPTGACCEADGSCLTITLAQCSGTYQGNATICQPNPCPQPTGACCINTTCSATTQAACSGTWQGAAVPCGQPGNPTTCCPANFNQTGGVSVADIFAFLSAWFASDPAADFNHDTQINVQDIFVFLSAWFTGC